MQANPKRHVEQKSNDLIEQTDSISAPHTFELPAEIGLEQPRASKKADPYRKWDQQFEKWAAYGFPLSSKTIPIPGPHPC